MLSKKYNRSMVATLEKRLREPRRFIQVLFGPRQVGKTTIARQAIENSGLPGHFASADAPTLESRVWLEQQWQLGRLKARGLNRRNQSAVLVVDEVQKIPDWSSVVKSLWDADSAAGLPLKVVLLGSAPLIMQKGLSESLAGRFEVIHVPHWSFAEMREAFRWDLDSYLHFGGYPGSAPLADDAERWRRYVSDSIIETTISRDILLMTRIDKPSLLRRMFQLGCAYSGQILSYQKMTGQLQDAGNTTTLAHYLELLGGSGFVAGLEKYSGAIVRKRASSPKLQVLNTALMTVTDYREIDEARHDREYWGCLVESAVGAHLLNQSRLAGIDVTYWRDRNREVDFILRKGRRLAAIEVKSGRLRHAHSGMEAFRKAHSGARMLLVGEGGIPLDEFLSNSIETWIE